MFKFLKPQKNLEVVRREMRWGEILQRLEFYEENRAAIKRFESALTGENYVRTGKIKTVARRVRTVRENSKSHQGE